MNTYSLPITQIDNQAVAQILSKTIIKTFDFHIEHTQLLASLFHKLYPKLSIISAQLNTIHLAINT